MKFILIFLITMMFVAVAFGFYCIRHPESDSFNWPTKKEDLSVFYDKCGIHSTDLVLPSLHRLAQCLEEK